ncbi:MAG: hypothetical protein NTV28_14085 [Propionibacteriales bacterium]|nr:hypothetical protein [Propionibacteriales bacterium]
MPGPRRTLAAALSAAVVGLFLVAGIGVTHAGAHQRATTTHTSAASSHQSAHVKASGQHVDQHHLDLWALPPESTPAAPTFEDDLVVDVSAAVVEPEAPHAAGRGPPTA